MYIRDYSWAAGGFYPTDAGKVERMLSEYLTADPGASFEGKRLRGAIAPHAGWVYSGPTAGKVFRAMADATAPNLVICFGAVHIHGVGKLTILSSGEWKTPLGNIPIDEETADRIITSMKDDIVESRFPHEEEHSLEVLMPFIKKCFPEVSVVPVMVPPDAKASSSGRRIAELLNDRDDVIYIGSTDMTHYGSRFGFAPEGRGTRAVKWVRDVNDRGLIDLILDMRADDVVGEAMRNQSACGAGAIAAVTAACKTAGASKGLLLDYTTSYDVRPRDGADTFVGYAGIVFE